MRQRISSIFNFNIHTKRFISCVICIAMTVMGLYYCSNLLENKSGNSKYKAFFAGDKNFDVLFFGSSHVMNGVFPMELWKDYGITSYNCGGLGNRLPASYWVMKNIFDYTTPKLVVIDCYFLSQNTKFDKSFLHLTFDGLPLSINKMKAAVELSDNGKSFPPSELIWNFTIYHSRWNELQKGDFQYGGNNNKGATYCVGVYQTEHNSNTLTEEKRETINSLGVEYLKKMIDECKKRGIEVLLIYNPTDPTDTALNEAENVYKIAEEYDLNYINFLEEDVINPMTDFADHAWHLNSSGGFKVTSYLGQYIINNYDIRNQCIDESVIAEWDDAYKPYKATKEHALRSQDSLEKWITVLDIKHYAILAEINRKELFNDPFYNELFLNIGVNIKKLASETGYVYIDNLNPEAAEYYEKNIGNLKKIESQIGGLNKAFEADIDPADVRIIVIDKAKHVQIDAVAINCLDGKVKLER